MGTVPKEEQPAAVALRAELDAQGISVRELARRLAGVETGYTKEAESERRAINKTLLEGRPLSDDRARRIADLLNKPDDWLIRERPARRTVRQRLEQVEAERDALLAELRRLRGDAP
jgi:transcriptional regulator with XRE-family HTH domain